MTVCANRTDNPGSFTACATVLGGRCICGDQVTADIVAAATSSTPSEGNHDET